MNTRIFLCAAFSLGVFACAGKSSDTANPSIASGPAAGESCAAYVGRSAPGVQCLTVDAGHCQCSLASAGPWPTQPTQPTQPITSQPTQPTQPTQPKPAGGVKMAKLTFQGAPDYTTVQCVSGPCPTSASVMISVAGYPDVPIAGEAATVRFDIKAPNYRGATVDFRLTPGENTIPWVAMVTRPSSRTALAKYLATWVAKAFGGSWP